MHRPAAADAQEHGTIFSGAASVVSSEASSAASVGSKGSPSGAPAVSGLTSARAPHPRTLAIVVEEEEPPQRPQLVSAGCVQRRIQLPEALLPEKAPLRPVASAAILRKPAAQPQAAALQNTRRQRARSVAAARPPKEKPTYIVPRISIDPPTPKRGTSPDAVTAGTEVAPYDALTGVYRPSAAIIAHYRAVMRGEAVDDAFTTACKFHEAGQAIEQQVQLAQKCSVPAVDEELAAARERQRAIGQALTDKQRGLASVAAMAINQLMAPVASEGDAPFPFALPPTVCRLASTGGFEEPTSHHRNMFVPRPSTTASQFAAAVLPNLARTAAVATPLYTLTQRMISGTGQQCEVWAVELSLTNRQPTDHHLFVGDDVRIRPLCQPRAKGSLTLAAPQHNNEAKLVLDVPDTPRPLVFSGAGGAGGVSDSCIIVDIGYNGAAISSLIGGVARWTAGSPLLATAPDGGAEARLLATAPTTVLHDTSREVIVVALDTTKDGRLAAVKIAVCAFSTTLHAAVAFRCASGLFSHTPRSKAFQDLTLLPLYAPLAYCVRGCFRAAPDAVHDVVSLHETWSALSAAQRSVVMRGM